jgi:RNA polymerase sigma-70 factor (ECF subfamily)
MCANPEDAADLTQDTFVKAIQNIAKFQKKSSFYTWLFRIAVNSTITHCKKNAKLAASSLDAEYCQNNNNASNELKAILTDPDAPDPAKIAQNRELCDLLLKTLLKLDEDHRAVIVLRDIEGMNYAQIANVLDIQVGTVKSRLSRARNNLRDLMEVIAS